MINVRHILAAVALAAPVVLPVLYFASLNPATVAITIPVALVLDTMIDALRRAR